MKEKFISNYNFVPLKGYEQFEATTQIIIKELLFRKINFEVLSVEENLLEFYYTDKVYVVKDGTISDANTLISFWISDNKWLTKLFLKRAQINVAEAVLIKRDAIDEVSRLSFPLVVKPKDTDHGIGVATNIIDKESLKNAIDDALKFSSEAIVERYYEGLEYRFLVIENVVRAVAYRMPANIVGDGKKSIKKLIEIKNANRGSDYRTPLLKIIVDREVQRTLKKNNYTLNTVLSENEQLFLRNNSNLSTGGDSIDITDEMSEHYKDIAVKATKSSGLNICGVDMIIKNISEEPNSDNHIVVELNAPAMLSMHSYPYVGKNREVEKYVLDAILHSK